MRSFLLPVCLLMGCVSAPVVGTLDSALAPSPVVEVAGGRVLEGSICPHADGSRPFIYLRSLPVMGGKLSMRFAMRGYLSHFDDADMRSAWVLLGTEELSTPIDFTPFGLTGCSLVANVTKALFFPGGFDTTYQGGVYRPTLWRDSNSGYIFLDWIIPNDPVIEGHKFYVLLLAESPGTNPAGFAMSHVYEIRVGVSPL